jgi:drug/metabolite transporter (DMT)-like permease
MSYTGYLYAIGAAITWGLVYTIDQRVLRSASPFALLFVDSIITAIILLPVLFLEKAPLASLTHTPLKTWVLIVVSILFVVVSILFAAVANYFIFSSIKLIDADHASIIEIAYPFFVVIFSYFAFAETPNLYFIFGTILIFAGSGLVIFFR